MKAIVVTNIHQNIGEELELYFTSSARYYSDDLDRLYSIKDFVELDMIDHEQSKADRLAEYWTIVSMTIQAYKAKEAACENMKESS